MPACAGSLSLLLANLKTPTQQQQGGACHPHAQHREQEKCTEKDVLKCLMFSTCQSADAVHNQSETNCATIFPVILHVFEC